MPPIFNPPDWIVQEYMRRKGPGEQVQEAIGGAIDTYGKMRLLEQDRAMKTAAAEREQAQFELMKQKEAREATNQGAERFFNFGDPTGLSPEMQSGMTNPVQGPVDAAGMPPQPSDTIKAFQEFRTRYPQGIKGKELQDKTAPTPLYDSTGKMIGNIPQNAKVVPAASSNALPKVPGYRYKPDGSMEPIPGGPAAMKVKAVEDKEAAMRSATVSQADAMIAKVDQALSKVNGWTTGWLGSVMSKVPGSEAVNLQKDVETIKANLAFAQLQEMRRNSPTGGALGAVSERELSLLESAVASLDTVQSTPQLRQRLNEIRTHYANWKNAVQQAGAAQSAAGAPAPAANDLSSMSDEELMRMANEG